MSGSLPRNALVLALAALSLTVAGVLLVAPPARAGFGPFELQSNGPNDQAEEASESAISADGQYLAFQASIDGVRGIYRKDLHTGRLQLVVGGSIYVNGGAGAGEAVAAPSISREGRYVSFTTTVALDPVDETAPVSSVYVRDMEVPAPETETKPCTAAQVQRSGAEGCPYELASALDGSRQSLTYPDGGGAVAAGRVALSADGREVAFVVTGTSNLAGPETPPMQVAVRYLDSQRTVLVSAEREASSGQMTNRPVVGGAAAAGGAALSADGSTVAWLGAHIPAQAPTLRDEAGLIDTDDSTPEESWSYNEPLWRRIADGPQAPTRRIVGGGDPLAPGCPPDGELSTPACRGPFPGLATEKRGGIETGLGWVTVSDYDALPQLSADGYTVALLGDPPYSTSNVFVADMHEGRDRVQALRQLTREVPIPFTFNPGGTNSFYVATAGNVYEVAISPDGTRIAFTTQREQFPLAPPYFAEPPLTTLGVAELYQIDLTTDSLVRVTHGPGDGPSVDPGAPRVTSLGATSPSYTQEGRTLAFADNASNLVSGDANGASDVFTVHNEESTGASGQVAVGPQPPPTTPVPQWRMSVVAVANPNGTVTLDVVVPAAGEVIATASAAVGATAAVARSVRHKHPTRARRASARAIATRTVGAARMAVAVPGLLEVPLRVATPYAKLLSSPAGIYATVRVTFAGAGGPPLAQTVVVGLRRVKSAHAGRRARRGRTKRHKPLDRHHARR